MDEATERHLQVRIQGLKDDILLRAMANEKLRQEVVRLRAANSRLRQEVEELEIELGRDY